MKRIWPWIGGAAILAWVVSIFLHDPASSPEFLPCPFHWLTGLFCPGCGAQRAMHDLLHGRVVAALDDNAVLVATIPLLGLQWGFGQWRGRSLTHDNRVVLAWGIGLVAWGVVRNLPGFEVLAP